jgi:hypothetical protein
LDYFANVGPARGPALCRDTPPAVDVLEAPDSPKLIGLASDAGWTENGIALWRLTVGGVVVPGRWAIIDRRFIPQFKSAKDVDQEA